MEHHVYFWLKDGEDTAEARADFEKGLRELFEIKTVAGGSWGVPADTEVREVCEQSWHYGLSIQFASRAAHDAYQTDPLHDDFVAKFSHLWERVQVMDLAKKA